MIDFLFELGQLKRVKRSGWWLIGIKDPETVAEHSFRAAAIGYFLAKKEGADEKKVMLYCLFNDMHEARINDLHKVGHRYIRFEKAEKQAFDEQISTLPGEMTEELRDMIDDLHEQKTKESIVARDSDLLECALQAREYMSHGYAEADDWLKNIGKIIKTENGKKMLKEIIDTDPNNWWKGLKRITR